MRRAMMLAGAAALAVAGAGLGAMPAQALDRYVCEEGYVCFYSETNGLGQKCSWEGNDDYWLNSPGRCSWAGTKIVKSVYNNGTSGMDVLYYDAVGSNGADKVGCVDHKEKKNITGSHLLRSHLWVSGGNCS
jgi:hypothetical protein